MSTITPLTTPAPTRDDPENFRTRADTLATELPTMVTEINVVIGELTTLAAGVDADVLTIAGYMESVSATAGAVEWVSGASYDFPDAVISPLDFNTYRAKQATSGTTDPSLDTTNWKQISSDLTDSPTITNPTLEGALIGGSLRLTRVAMSTGEIDLSQGGYFTKTISAETTFTLSGLPTAGEFVYFILDLTNPGSAVMNWFSGTINWPWGVQPTWPASGRAVVAFWSYDNTNWSTGLLGQYT